MIRIDKPLLDEISQKAANSDRMRTNYNFHTEASDPIQRMLNAMEPGTYVRPHKHMEPVKREAFVILRGRILFIEFDDTGKISDHFILDANTGNYGLEISPAKYHSLISLEKGSVLFEIKDGPYDASSDKIFAPWSPEETLENGKIFNEKILKELGME